MQDMPRRVIERHVSLTRNSNAWSTVSSHCSSFRWQRRQHMKRVRVTIWNTRLSVTYPMVCSITSSIFFQSKPLFPPRGFLPGGGTSGNIFGFSISPTTLINITTNTLNNSNALLFWLTASLHSSVIPASFRRWLWTVLTPLTNKFRQYSFDMWVHVVVGLSLILLKIWFYFKCNFWL